MWEEAQLSRTQVVSLGGIKSEGTNNNIAFEGGQSPFVGMDIKGNEAVVFPQPKCGESTDLISLPNHFPASASTNSNVAT